MPVPEKNLKSGLSKRFEKYILADDTTPGWFYDKFFQGLHAINIDIPDGLSKEDERMAKRELSKKFNVGQIFNAWS